MIFKELILNNFMIFKELIPVNVMFVGFLIGVVAICYAICYAMSKCRGGGELVNEADVAN
jgi:hypothetical protein